LSPRLPAVKTRELIRVLERDGWVPVSQRGSHLKLRKTGVRNGVIVPIHRGDVRAGLLRTIIASAGISEDRFLELLRD
jgi:predicted RNA binding protein YcfA (HicA-like mRNA interferase family)